MEEWTPEPLVKPSRTDRSPPVLQTAAGTNPRVDGKRVLNFASFNFLGLAGHKAIEVSNDPMIFALL